MSKKFIWLSIVVLSLTIGQTSFACATDKNKTAHCDCKQGSSRTTDKLNLTDEQKVKIQALKTQNLQTFKTNIQKLKAIRPQIISLINSDKMDETKLDALLAQRSQIKNSMVKNRIMMQHQIYSLLTEEQKSKYRDLTKKVTATR